MDYQVIRNNKPEEKEREIVLVKPEEAPKQVVMATQGKTKATYRKEENTFLEAERSEAMTAFDSLTTQQLKTLCDMLQAKRDGDFERVIEIAKKTSEEDCKTICDFLELVNDGKKG